MFDIGLTLRVVIFALYFDTTDAVRWKLRWRFCAP